MGFTDENVKVWHDDQPHHLTEVFGLCYQEFTDTPDMRLWGENSLSGATCSAWEELLIPTTAKVLASYDNPAWQPYAAVTENVYGKGKAWYLAAISRRRISSNSCGPSSRKHCPPSGPMMRCSRASSARAITRRAIA